MRVIEISDEMYGFLMELSHELNTQDNRATAMPYIFQVRETKEIPTCDGAGEEIWVLDDHCLRNETDVKDAVFEYKDWDPESEDDQQKYAALNDWEITRILSENYRKINFTEQYVYHNAFLTEKACREHIKQNKHHYGNPVDFLTYAFRNPELEMLLKFLKGLNQENK